MEVHGLMHEAFSVGENWEIVTCTALVHGTVRGNEPARFVVLLRKLQEPMMVTRGGRGLRGFGAENHRPRDQLGGTRRQRTKNECGGGHPLARECSKRSRQGAKGLGKDSGKNASKDQGNMRSRMIPGA